MAEAEEVAGLTAREEEIHARRLRRVTSMRVLGRSVRTALQVSTDISDRLRLRSTDVESPTANTPNRPKEPGAMFDEYAYDEDDTGAKIPRGRILQAEFVDMMRTEYGDVRDDDVLSLWDGFLASENAAARAHHQPQEHMLSKGEFVKHILQYGITDYERDVDDPSSAVDYGDIDLQEASERDVRQRQDGIRCCQPKTWFIHPDGAFRVSWDLWLLVLIFYVAFCVPLRIGFDIEVEPGSAWFIVDLVADLTFFVDLFLNFFTGYMDSFGLRVSRGRDVKMNYLGWGPQKNYTIAPADLERTPRENFSGSGMALAATRGALDGDALMSVDVKFQKEEEAGDATACLNICTCCCGRCCHAGVPRSCRQCALVVTKLARMPLRGWFVVDFVSCLPVTYIALIVDAATDEINSDGSVEGGTMVGSTRAIRILRLLRLAKLLRLARIGRLLDKYCEDLREFYQAMAVFRAVCTTITMAHWTACAWHFLGVQGVEECTAPSTEGCTSWFQTSALSELGSDTDRLWDRYYTSLYWSATTLTTVGYGDITPVTNSEMMFAVFIEILGTCTFAYTAGTLSSVIMESKLDPKIQEYNEKMPKIKEYLRSHRVPRPERIRIRAHFDRVFHEHKAIDERNVLELMPGGLKGAMARNVVKTIYSDTYKLLATSKLFFSLTEIALVDLIVRLEPLRFRGPCRECPDGEEIIRQGHSCVDTYIISSGYCRSIARADPPYDEDGMYDRPLAGDDVEMLLRKGEIFGERSALGHGGGVDRMESTHTVLAKGQPPAADLLVSREGRKDFLRRRWTPSTAESHPPSMTTVQVLSAANLASFLDEYAEYRAKLPAVVRVQIEKEEHRKRGLKLKALCPTRKDAEAQFSGIIDAWSDRSDGWSEQGVKEVLRKMKQAGGGQVEAVRSRNGRDCLAIVQVQVFLSPWQRWLVSTTLPEPEYMALLSDIFDPDGDHDITREEFWHGLNELKHPKHFKRKAAVVGVDKQMEAVADELNNVKKEVTIVQGKLQDQFTTVQTHLTDLTSNFQQFIEAHGRTN